MEILQILKLENVNVIGSTLYIHYSPSSLTGSLKDLLDEYQNPSSASFLKGVLVGFAMAKSTGCAALQWIELQCEDYSETISLEINEL